MSRNRRTALLAVVGLLASGLAVMFSSSPAAALPVCNGYTWVGPSNGQARLPSVNGSLDCVMGQGASSSAVWALQYTINECYHPEVVKTALVQDGIFGGNTRAALVKVQGHVGTARDGVYGPNTRRAMLWRITGFACARVG